MEFNLEDAGIEMADIGLPALATASLLPITRQFADVGKKVCSRDANTHILPAPNQYTDRRLLRCMDGASSYVMEAQMC